MFQEFPDPFELFLPEPPQLPLAERRMPSFRTVPALSEGEIDFRLDALFENPVNHLLELMPEDLFPTQRSTYPPRS